MKIVSIDKVEGLLGCISSSMYVGGEELWRGTGQLWPPARGKGEMLSMGG